MAVVGGDPVEVPAIRGTTLGYGPGNGPLWDNGTRTPDAYTLGWDPGYLDASQLEAATVRGGAAGLGQGAAGSGARLAELAGQGASSLNANAQGLGRLGIDAQQQSIGFDQRQTPTANFNPATAAIQNQQGIAARLAGEAGRSTESGAQAQLQSGINEAINSQMSMAKSGSGFGASAAGMNQAASNAGALIAEKANQAALLKAQTDQADAARGLQALDAAGSQYAGSGAALGSLAGRDAELRLQGLSANDARAQAMQDLGMQYQGLGQQGLQSGVQTGIEGAQYGANFGLQGQLEAQRLGLDAGTQQLMAEQQKMQGANMALAGREQYEADLNQLYGIDKGVELGNRQLENQADMQNANAALSTGTALLSIAAMASDERTKKNVRLESLRNRYAAIHAA